MFRSLAQQYRRYASERLKLAAFLAWVQTHAPGACVHAHISSGVRGYRVAHAGPLTRVDPSSIAPDALFVSSMAHTERDVCRDLYSSEDLQPLYETPALRIFMRSGLRFADDPLPVLTDADRRQLLAAARSMMRQYLETGAVQYVPPIVTDPLFGSVRGFDVAVWCDGALRGSIISHTEYPFHERFVATACAATRDTRFAPLSPAELDRSVIEITIMSDLHIPLSPAEVEEHVPYEHLGYVARTPERSYGWFLPMVFNDASFRSFPELMQGLIHEKARVPAADLRRVQVHTFPVLGFIESPDGGAVELAGPVPEASPDPISVRDVREMCDAAAEHLVRLVEDDGYLPPMVVPMHCSRRYFDLPRTAFAAFALATYGSMTDCTRFLDAASRIAGYCIGQLPKYPADAGTALACAYLGQYRHATGDGERALGYARGLAEQDARHADMDTITRSQVARLLQLTGSTDAAHAHLAKSLVDGLVRDFFTKLREDEATISLAEYAELVVLTAAAGMWTEHERIAQWYCDRQFVRGGFPDTPSSSYQYVRGTGKVLEALCYHPTPNAHDAIDRAFSWVRTMQYTSDALYHIPAHMRELFEGGFRHDYANRDAWIDGAAHVLAAGARYLRSSSHG